MADIKFFTGQNNLSHQVQASGSISVTKLKKLEAETCTQLFVLLVDCRPESAFKKERIIAFPCVNVPPSLEVHLTDPSRLTTKPAVVNFLNDNHVDFLTVLNAPGSYTHIIVFDDGSTPGKCSRTVLTMLTALRTWNENTRTETLLLDKGFTNVKRRYEPMVGPSDDDTVQFPWYYPETIHKQPLLVLPPDPNSTDNDYKQVESTFHALVKKLKEVIVSKKHLLRKRQGVRSVEAIKSALQQEHGTLQGEPNIPVPVDMECPVCFDAFTEEIFQCINGHCICSSCYKDLITCPECRTPYPKGNGIRNRALERIMNTSRTVDCPHSTHGCGEKLTYNQVSTHMKSCIYGVFSAVVVLEDALSNAKPVIALCNQYLKTVTEELIIAEENWTSAINQWNTPADLVDKRQWYVEQVFSLKVALLNLDMAMVM